MGKKGARPSPQPMCPLEHVALAWGARGRGCGGFMSRKDACLGTSCCHQGPRGLPQWGSKAGLTIEIWGETPPCPGKPHLTRLQTSCCRGDQCHPGWALGAPGAPGRPPGATGAGTGEKARGRSVPGSDPHLTRTEPLELVL